jgi:hypothetical protein
VSVETENQKPTGAGAKQAGSADQGDAVEARADRQRSRPPASRRGQHVGCPRAAGARVRVVGFGLHAENACASRAAPRL